MTPTTSRKLRFGDFEADLATGELRKFGIPIKIQDQPMRVLAALLERPGEVVTRDEFQQRLWPDVQALDFEHGLNMAVRKLRAALNDSADTPRFIETLPRKGYRFIAPLAGAAEEAAAPPPAQRSIARRGAIVIAALLTLAGIGAVWRSDPGPQEKVSVLYSNSGGTNQIAFSPDGSSIAFTAVTLGQPSRVYIKTPGISAPRRLTDDAEPTHTESNIGWIPDGSGITFVRRERGYPSALYLAPVTGGTPRKLLDIEASFSYSWSPDSKFIATSLPDASGRPAIYLVSIPDGKQCQLSFPPPDPPNSGPGLGGDMGPRFSPDGKTIAFARRSGKAFTVMTIPAAGGTAMEIVTHPNRPHDIFWAADGKEIVYCLPPQVDAPSVYRVNVSSGKPRPIHLAPLEANITALAVSEKSHRLVFAVSSMRSRIWRYDLPRGSSAPPTPSRAAESDSIQSSPAFSPDGKRFAFSSTRNGNYEIYLSDLEGGQPMQLTNFGKGETGWPRWSPDGRQIAFDARPNGQSGVYVVDSAGGTPRLLTRASGHAVMPEWSPDGTTIYYTLDTAQGSDIWKVPAAGGTPVRITTDGSFGTIPSPDGKTLYAGVRRKPRLRAIPLNGQDAPEAIDGPRHGLMAGATSGIYFVQLAPNRGPARLMQYSYATKKTTLRLQFQGSPIAPALAVSPDESQVLFSQFDEFLSRIMLVENFR